MQTYIPDPKKSKQPIIRGTAMKETEIRKFGDGQTLVVRTRNLDLYKELRRWDSCERVLDYKQPREPNGYPADVMVWDLYFPKQMEWQLHLALSNHRQTQHTGGKR